MLVRGARGCRNEADFALAHPDRGLVVRMPPTPGSL